MIVIRYAIPPDLIVFSLGNVTYIIERHKDTPRTPYTVTEVGGLTTKTNNIGEWIALKTKARYNLDLLYDLANAFIMGRESAYNQDDLNSCANLVFEHTITTLFHDGLAGRYADNCDIECMSLSEIKQSLNNAHSINVPQDRVRRFMRVSQKNGWSSLADSWAKLLEGSYENQSDRSKLDMASPVVDNTIKRSISRLVSSEFTKDKNYTDTIDIIKQQHPIGSSDGG